MNVVTFTGKEWFGLGSFCLCWCRIGRIRFLVEILVTAPVPVLAFRPELGRLVQCGGVRFVAADAASAGALLVVILLPGAFSELFLVVLLMMIALILERYLQTVGVARNGGRRHRSGGAASS